MSDVTDESESTKEPEAPKVQSVGTLLAAFKGFDFGLALRARRVLRAKGKHRKVKTASCLLQTSGPTVCGKIDV